MHSMHACVHTCIVCMHAYHACISCMHIMHACMHACMDACYSTQDAALPIQWLRASFIRCPEKYVRQPCFWGSRLLLRPRAGSATSALRYHEKSLAEYFDSTWKLMHSCVGMRIMSCIGALHACQGVCRCLRFFLQVSGCRHRTLRCVHRGTARSHNRVDLAGSSPTAASPPQTDVW